MNIFLTKDGFVDVCIVVVGMLTLFELLQTPLLIRWIVRVRKAHKEVNHG